MPGQSMPPNPWSYATAGVEFACAFALVLAAGILLDRRYGSTPYLTLASGAMGFGIALRNLLRRVRRAGGQDESSLARKSPGRRDDAPER